MTWISVEDRLPAMGTPVLILRNGKVRIGERYEDSYKPFWYWDDPHDDGQGWENDEITHWMPLPDLPNKKNTKPNWLEVAGWIPVSCKTTKE